MKNLSELNSSVLSGKGELSDGTSFEINTAFSFVSIGEDFYVQDWQAVELISQLFEKYKNSTVTVVELIEQIHINL